MTLYANTLSNDAKEFISWLNVAEPGENYIYYKGYIGESKSNILSSLKQTVWKSAVNGRVYLLQRKNGPSEYDYLAQKSAKKYPCIVARLIPWDYFHQGKMPHMLRKPNG